ncbi:C39 family peptidase [Methanobacterium aggregans]|uniref:C39 family peptidase n=2 Tax=Methanobacterium aggregans TaxID=1615586 RepID=UPI001FD8DCAB|nr:cysteine peptidase family C39 domain-containing protein [Methanobacterium aggregans]MBP2046764.1 putative double-glycine peptidase [Methanobacterium aggregans]
MNRIAALLIATVILCTTPSIAVAVSADSQNSNMVNVKGKGTDSELEIPIENETAELTALSEEKVRLDLGQEDNSSMNTSEEQINESLSDVPSNTTGVVMQTTNYTCGPASLATALNNMGLNATELELAALAGTDENGTTMYGLLQAARSKGLNATGMKISSNDLKSNNIVYMTVNGGAHYSVIRDINNETVLLADPSLGNINLTREEFEEEYNGYALVVDDPRTCDMERSAVNTENDPEKSSSDSAPETPEDTCNDTDSTLANPQNRTLSQDEMMGIKGKNWKYRINKKMKKKKKWKKKAWYNRSFNFWKIYYYGAHCAQIIGGLGVVHPAGRVAFVLGYTYLNTVGKKHVNEGWWLYGIT